MRKRYWHLLSKRWQDYIVKKDPRYALRHYKEPSWCDLPLKMGCMSLIQGYIHTRRDCGKCDLTKEAMAAWAKRNAKRKKLEIPG